MRLIFSFLLFVLGALFAPLSFADSVLPTKGVYTACYHALPSNGVCSGEGGQGATMLEAFQRVAAARGYPDGALVTYQWWANMNTSVAQYKLFYGGSDLAAMWYINRDAQNPECPSGYEYNAATGMCDVPAPACVVDEVVSAGLYDIGIDPDGVPQQTGCDNSCFVNYDGEGVTSVSRVNGELHFFVTGRYVKSGASCSSGEPSPGVAVPSGLTCELPKQLNVAGDACITDSDPFSQCPEGQVKIGFTEAGPICHTPSGAPPDTSTSCPTGQTKVPGVNGAAAFCVMSNDSCLTDSSCTALVDGTGATPDSYSNGTKPTAGAGTGEAGAASGVPETIEGMPEDVAQGAIDSLEQLQKQRDELQDYILQLPSADAPAGWVRLFQPFGVRDCFAMHWTFGSPRTGGHSYTANFDICPYVETVQNIFGWALYLLTGGLLFGMFTRRPEGGD